MQPQPTLSPNPPNKISYAQPTPNKIMLMDQEPIYALFIDLQPTIFNIHLKKGLSLTTKLYSDGAEINVGTFLIEVLCVVALSEGTRHETITETCI